MSSTDDLGAQLTLVDNPRSVDIINTIESAGLTETIDGASSLEVTCGDATRQLLLAPEVATRSVAVVAGISYEVAGLRKSGDRYTLVFEDQVVAKLRREDKHLVRKGGTTTRADFARHLAREAGVAISVDPDLDRRKVATPLERSASGQKSNSWDVLGSDVAEPLHARRFSDGTQLLIGGDNWLAARHAVIELRENVGAVGNIDFDLDQGKRASTATVTVDADLFAARPGYAVSLAGMGPADGRWLVQQFTRLLTSSRGTVTLTRARHVLAEPKPKKKKSTKKDDDKKGDDS